MIRNISLLSESSFDLLVCGGGVYGAWTAYDAAMRGLKVAIVEQGDWASATSSASSKLIHGGLRYLETYDFKLVKKALAERQMLLSMAPHRVWPLRFGVPLFRNGRIGTFKLKAGLTLYDLLARCRNTIHEHRRFGPEVFSEHFPALVKKGLMGGFTYSDAQTDDARLVLELIAGAMSAGAVCVNYCRLTQYDENNGVVSGATVEDLIGKSSTHVAAKQIVYATGQWTILAERGREWCRLTKGVHLVMPSLHIDEALLLTARSDGRVFFVIPWYGRTVIGTTDTDYQGDSDHVSVEPEDISYLLNEANNYLSVSWTEKDVIGSYAGVRVMKRSGKTSPSAVSRDWELKTSNSGLHYSIGGKLTSSRGDAAHIVDTVCGNLGIKAQCATKDHRFPWTPENNFSEWIKDVNAQAKKLGIDESCVKWLVRRHGKRVREVMDSIAETPGMAERILPELPLIHADLLFCARNEMIVHLDDLLRRRMPLMILARLEEGTLRRIAETIAPMMGWNETDVKREVATCIKS